MGMVGLGWFAGGESCFGVCRHCWRGIAKVVEVESAGVCSQQECLRTQSVNYGRRVGSGGGRGAVKRDAEFAGDFAAFGISGFEDAVAASGVQVSAVETVGETSTAAFVAFRAPGGVDDVGAVAASSFWPRDS